MIALSQHSATSGSAWHLYPQPNTGTEINNSVTQRASWIVTSQRKLGRYIYDTLQPFFMYPAAMMPKLSNPRDLQKEITWKPDSCIVHLGGRLEGETVCVFPYDVSRHMSIIC